MHIAIVGATGAVGREILSLLEQRGVPAEELTLLASVRSAGREVAYGDTKLQILELSDASFRGTDLALFSAGSDISQAFAGTAQDAGAVVIDNSSAFRLHHGVPLVVPEVNPDDIRDHHGLIANPNCSTIILVLAVWPIHRVNPVRRIVVSTYQAISGAGAAAMEELRGQTRDVLEGRPVQPRALPHRSAFNLFSHDSPVGQDGYNQEERKMAEETRKMFHDPAILVSATCVRVPVLRVHSESIHLSCERPITDTHAREILAGAPGVKVVDDRCGNVFPMPVDASGQDDVLVGRIRRDASDPSGRGIAMFVCGDQLRKGAALNTIQIADLLSG